MTPFLMAVTHGAVEAARVLESHGADILATDNSLNSAIHLAIMYRQSEMLKTLLEMDKDHRLTNMTDKDKKNVFHLACGQETSEVTNPYIMFIIDQYIYLVYGYNSTRSLIGCFLVMTGHY